MTHLLRWPMLLAIGALIGFSMGSPPLGILLLVGWTAFVLGRRRWVEGPSGREMRRRGRRRERVVRTRTEGLDQVWDLRGITLRLRPHEVIGMGERHSVHDLAGIARKGSRVMLLGLDGERLTLGRSRASKGALDEALAEIDAGIRQRRRGSLADRSAMHGELDGLRQGREREAVPR